MRVVLNGLAALKPKTGVGHHVADLFSALNAEHSPHHFSLYPGQWLRRATAAFNRPLGLPGDAMAMAPGRLAWLRRTAKSVAKNACRFHFNGFARTFGFDLYHEPNFVPFPSHLPTVVTVHDLSVLKYPQWHPADRVKMHQKQFLKGLEQARHVIVVSQSVRRELIEELQCPADRVSAVYNGIGTQYVPQSLEAQRAVRAKWKLPDRFFLCVGTIEPRKNIATVMQAFLDLPSAIREQCPLVLAGPWGWRSEVERELFRLHGPASGIHHIGYVSDGDLPRLYSAARVLLYPSHYEGFGLPPVEMLACGGAVIASTAAALQEVIGGQAWFVEPDDRSGWRGTMQRAATDDQFLNQLRRGGIDHARRYSWAHAAQETIAVFEHVLGMRKPSDSLAARVAA